MSVRVRVLSQLEQTGREISARATALGIPLGARTLPRGVMSTPTASPIFLLAVRAC